MLIPLAGSTLNGVPCTDSWPTGYWGITGKKEANTARKEVAHDKGSENHLCRKDQNVTYKHIYTFQRAIILLCGIWI
jgi:hypothetical protein